MVTDYFFVYSFIFQCEEKKWEKILGSVLKFFTWLDSVELLGFNKWYCNIDLNLERPQLKSKEIIFLVHFDICYNLRASFSDNLHNSWSIKQLH